MKTATYLVALVRSHVRGSAPMATHELNDLKMAVNHLSLLGRSLQQVVLCGGASAEVSSDVTRRVADLAAQVADVRRCLADVVRVNLMSWEVRDA
jgi:hypothetical protein